MAKAAVCFLLEELKEPFVDQINLLIKGDEVARWIEYELDTLRPLLETIGGADQNLANMRKSILKAEHLAETHTKREIQRRAATIFDAPIYAVRAWRISLKLHRIKKQIADCSKNIPSLVHAPDQHTVPSHLRRCMYYLLLFPPGYQVPARRLIVLWIAEGLIHPRKYQATSVEQIAHGYLNELRRLEVITVEEKRSGKLMCSIDSCRRDALMEEAKKAEFFEEGNKGVVRRLVDHSGSGGADCHSFIQINGNTEISKKVPNYRDVISFLSFNTEEGSKPGEDIGDFLRRCISNGFFVWLRVLDLERVFRPKLPDTLGKLIAMKYLGLRWTYLQVLPEFVDELLNLQVLDIKHTYISVLPRSIWRMQYLRHLYLSEAYRTRFPQPPSKVTLDALQTLWGAFVDEDTPVVKGLVILQNIRKLGLSCRPSRESGVAKMSNQLDAIDRWISNLEFLETLRFKSRDVNNEAADLRLTSLEGNRKLSSVYLLGKLESFVVCRLPVSLTNVTLSGSELNLDPLGFLGRLPNLVILRLLGQSVVCSKMCCSKRGFHRLKVLWIWKLENLEVFEAEEGSLPCLEELEIRDCRELKALPDRLRYVQNLEIKLTSMPPEFVQETEGKYAQIRKHDQYILKSTHETKGKQMVDFRDIRIQHSGSD